MYDRKTICKMCNSVILEDGTPVNCTGECDRQVETLQAEQPLNFDDVVQDPNWIDGWDDQDLVSGDLGNIDDLDYEDDDGVEW